MDPSCSRRACVGMWLGPLLALLVYGVLYETVPEMPRRTAGIAVLLAVYWITEALPLAATALIPLVAFPLFGVLSIENAAAAYSKPVIFLFLGGFMMALAVEKSGLHRRMALLMMRMAGQSPSMLLAGFMFTTAFLSMWISNTPTVVMMIPIAISLVSVLYSGESSAVDGQERNNFEVCLLLGIAYSASIGGLGTLVGTPPNALLAGALADIGIPLGFGRWMLFAIPLVIVMLILLWCILTWSLLPRSIRYSQIDRSIIRNWNNELGSMKRGEWTVLFVFLTTASLWILREPLQNWESLVQLVPAIGRLNDASISVGAAVVLFLLPVDKSGVRALDWQSAQRLPWGVLILIGGGMSLAVGMNDSGLSSYVAEELMGLQVLPAFLLIITVTGVTIFLTEITSNTATIATLLPVLLGLGLQMKVGPLPLMVSAALAASCAFMLPIATPPNAVIFDTGRIRMGTMAKFGFWLNLTGIVLISLWVFLLGNVVFGSK